MPRSTSAPIIPAPPEAAAALSAALAASGFGLGTLFTVRGNRMADPDVLAAAASIARPLPRGARHDRD